MKKKIWIPIVVTVVVLLAVLFVPIPQGSYDDGGTREYVALTYKIVDWNRLTNDGVYEKTQVYFWPERNKGIDELWEQEAENVENKFVATVVEINGDSVLVEPFENEGERLSSDRISFSVSSFEDIDVKVGDFIEVTYKGGIMESYPAQIHATGWKLATDLRTIEYTGTWLNKNKAKQYDHRIFSDIIITKIYSNCFFAQTVIPMPYEIKLNGTLSEDWCVGDQVLCTYENTYYEEATQRVEVDMLTIDVSNFTPDPNACYKPVIYFYPEEEMQVSVKLTLDGRLTCTYPMYNNGWTVTAMPDGTLIDEKDQAYNYLYWEGETSAQYDLSKGFCIKGEDTAAFLEEALADLGLTRREANEFIVYWLPLMQENPYNIISFQTDIYTEAAKLDVTPTPDTMIRVFMAWQATDSYVELAPQDLTAPERKGFTVVEWGGTEV